ncbi:hypothetical protein [Aestuariivirga sp.]|uniref:hypothetical protein n=1 Tax=Aestuariivirga sp. TaxID=2650926 RepID=UPI003BAB5FD0
MREKRRWFIHAVLFAFVLPVLLGLVPQQALSASAALDRDIQLSVCGKDGSQQGGGGSHQSPHEHCILCSSGCPSCSPALGAAAPAFAAVPRPVAVPQPSQTLSLSPPLRALLDASPPRGPPSLS